MSSQSLLTPVLLVLVVLSVTGVSCSGPDAVRDTGLLTPGKNESVSAAAAIREASLGDTRNVHRIDDLWLAGQFTEEDIPALKEAGIRRVITLRTDGEIDWDEPAELEKAGLDFVAVPFREPETLTDEVFDTIRELLRNEPTATLFHCGSANRVGGAWLPYRVLDEGVDLETAIQEAKTIGLRNEGYLDKARDYIERHRGQE